MKPTWASGSIFMTSTIEILSANHLYIDIPFGSHGKFNDRWLMHHQHTHSYTFQHHQIIDYAFGVPFGYQIFVIFSGQINISGVNVRSNSILLYKQCPNNCKYLSGWLLFTISWIVPSCNPCSSCPPLNDRVPDWYYGETSQYPSISLYKYICLFHRSKFCLTT